MSGAPIRRLLRVAVVTETYPPEINGVARTIGAMVEGLRARGHSIHLVRPRQSRADAAGLDTMLCRGVPLPRYRDLRMGLPAKRALIRAWRLQRPDIVQVVTEGPLGGSAIAAARALGIPVVSEFHTKFSDYSHHYGFGFFSKLVAGYLRRLHNRADCTLVPTEEMRTQLAATGYRKTAVVGRGIDLALFNPERRNAALRRNWGADDHQLVALYVGRLAPEKNLRLFVEACRAMQASAPDMRVIVVGDGPDGARLRQAQPDFVFAGMQSGAALAQHYASADVFLFPSMTETFGNVTTEALASGLAVVAFDYAAARQHIRHCTNGMLAPYGEQAAFIDAARALALDRTLCERIQSAASASARMLAWDRVIDELEGVFAEATTESYAGRIAHASL
jgi:glycosyltransferase involved in cell wall biosynthesis